MNMHSKLNYTLIFILFFITTFFSCAYYNTFYNAENLYNQAQTLSSQTSQQTNPTTQQTGTVNQQAVNLYEQAIKKCAKVIENHPHSDYVDDATLLMGNCFYEQKKYAKAIEMYQQLIDFSFSRKRYESALRDSLKVYQIKKQSDQNTKRIKVVMDSLKKELKKIPEVEDTNVEFAYYMMGKSYLALNEYSKAIETLNLGRSRFPKGKHQQEILLTIGDIYYSQKNYESAQITYSNLADNFPKTPAGKKALFLAGESYFAVKDYESAKEKYKLLLKRGLDKKAKYETTFRYGECFIELKQYDSAIAIYKKLRKEYRKDIDKVGQIDLKIGLCYRYLGQTDKALETFKKIIKTNPRTLLSASASYEIGLLYQEDLKDLDTAKSAFDSVKVYSPQRDADVVKQALIKSSDISKIKQYKQTIEKDTTGALAKTLMDLADLYLFGMKDYKSALETYKDLLKNYPNDSLYSPKSAFAIAWILDQTDNIENGISDSAIVSYIRVIKDYPNTDYSRKAKTILGIPDTTKVIDLAEIKYKFAEKLLDNTDSTSINSALAIFNEIAKNYPESNYASMSLYAIGWIYENRLFFPEDSTRAYRESKLAYQTVIDKYPKSELARFADAKLKSPTFTGKIPESVKDTTTTKIRETTSTTQPITTPEQPKEYEEYECDLPPQLLRQEEVFCPDIENNPDLGGIMKFRVLVAENGTVKDILITQRTQLNCDFALIDSVRKWLYSPGMKNGKNVSVWVEEQIQIGNMQQKGNDDNDNNGGDDNGGEE